MSIEDVQHHVLLLVFAVIGVCLVIAGLGFYIATLGRTIEQLTERVRKLEQQREGTRDEQPT